MTRWEFGSARELFEAAREASRDAERIRRQLLAMEDRATSLGGGGLGARVRSTGDPDRMGARVAAKVDREQQLARRQTEDLNLVDRACEVLYGRGGGGGLDRLVPEAWWCDVLWWRYLEGATWEEVGEAVGYSPRRCFDVAQAALDIADAAGAFSAGIGMGVAEG